MISHIKKYKTLYILALITLIFIVLPLLTLRLPSGHDYKYHMGRIYQIAQNIQNGKWFAPLYFGQINGYGYASPLFYGDVLLHLPGAAVAAGLPVETALRYFIMLCVAGTAFISYFCAKSMMKNDIQALITSVVYTFSSYMCIDFITRVALGEIQAFVFLPLAMLGFWSVICGDGSKWLLLPVGLALTLISHTLSAAVAAFFFLIIALLYIGDLLREKVRILYIGASAVIFFALSAFFLLPLLEQYAYQPLRLSDGTTDTIWGTLIDRSMPLWRTVYDFNISDELSAWMPNGIGLAFPVTLLTGAAVIAVKKKKGGPFVLFSVLTVITLFACSSLFPWGTLQNLLGSLQFPWRLLLFATLFSALAAGYATGLLVNKKAQAGFAAAVILLSLFSYTVTALPKLNTMIKNEKNNTALNEDWHDSLGAAEYLPSGSNWTTMIKKGCVATSNSEEINNTIKLEKRFDSLSAEFSGNSGDQNTWIRLPLVMYKGYTAVSDDGTPIELSCVNGYMTADVTGIESCLFTVSYTGTAVQTAGRIISILTSVCLVLFMIFRKKVKIPSRIRIPAQADTE